MKTIFIVFLMLLGGGLDARAVDAMFPRTGKNALQKRFNDLGIKNLQDLQVLVRQVNEEEPLTFEEAKSFIVNLGATFGERLEMSSAGPYRSNLINTREPLGSEQLRKILVQAQDNPELKPLIQQVLLTILRLKTDRFSVVQKILLSVGGVLPVGGYAGFLYWLDYHLALDALSALVHWAAYVPLGGLAAAGVGGYAVIRGLRKNRYQSEANELWRDFFRAAFPGTDWSRHQTVLSCREALLP